VEITVRGEPRFALNSRIRHQRVFQSLRATGRFDSQRPESGKRGELSPIPQIPYTSAPSHVPVGIGVLEIDGIINLL
jgi:hypothetical protein